MPNTYTPNYHLAKPSQGDVNWDDEINGNFDIIDQVLTQVTTSLGRHAINTDNPHNTTYAQVGAAPTSHTHQGSDILGQVSYAANADRTDNIHLKTENNLLYFSTDNINWTVTGEMTKAVYDTNNDGIVDNADRVDGYDTAIASNPNTVAVRNSNGDLSARVFGSTVSSGTPPITVASTTVCTNLNADMVDSQHASDFLLLNNTSSVNINVPSGQTINFQTGGTTRAYVNDYGIVGAVYNADIAEGFYTDEEQLPAEGTVMTINKHGRAVVAKKGSRFLGIVSYHPGLLLGMSHNWEVEFEHNRKIPIALVGQVRVVVNGGRAGVSPGDWLSTDSNGSLRKASWFSEKVAVALEPVSPKRKERIKVLIR